jgi:hypothetical protein
MERGTITTISRIMSVHCCVRAHLNRFKIVDETMCVCLEDYETVDHIIWKCPRFQEQRTRLVDKLNSEGIGEGTPMRDICIVNIFSMNIIQKSQYPHR